MRAALLWMIAAFLATLVLVARAVDDDLIDCCKTPGKVLSKFDGQINCGLIYVLPKETLMYFLKPKFDLKGLGEVLPCLIECIYKKSGFLKRDKTIKEQKLRKKIIEMSERSSEDVKPIIQAGLDTCFSQINEKATQIQEVNRVNLSGNGCKVEPTLVWSCLGGYVLYNCPASNWKEDEPKCAGKREQFMNSSLAIRAGARETAVAQQNAASEQQQ